MIPRGGSRQIAVYLPQSGFSAGRHRVRRLMNILGLQAIYKGPNTRCLATHACMCERGQEAPTAPHLPLPAEKTGDHPTQSGSPLRHAAHTLPGKGCSDITYIPVKNGFLYLVAIMDWATRKVLIWRPSNTLDASFCVEALEEAISKYGKPEIMNTPSRDHAAHNPAGQGIRAANIQAPAGSQL